MQIFRVWACTNISRKILYGFTLWNFVQCFIEKQGVRLISMRRGALKEYTEICLIFFWVVLYFLCIFEVYMNFWNIKWKLKIRKIAAQCWAGILDWGIVVQPAHASQRCACSTQSPRDRRGFTGGLGVARSAAWARGWWGEITGQEGWWHDSPMGVGHWRGGEWGGELRRWRRGPVARGCRGRWGRPINWRRRGA
jgi:hypothetical protein